MNDDIKTIVYGILSDTKYSKMHDLSRRVYALDGVAPTIHCMGGGNLEPKIVVPVYEKVCPTITSRDYKGPLLVMEISNERCDKADAAILCIKNEII